MSGYDLESFAQGVGGGLRAALMIIERNEDYARARKELMRYIDENQEKIDDIVQPKRGSRKMVWDDLYFRAPLMTAADLGLDA